MLRMLDFESIPTRFIDNKYLQWYLLLMKHRRIYPASGYTERHHIIPSSLGGSNSPENLVRLTAREHFICHRLLTKFTSGADCRKMNFALSFFATRCKNHSRKLSSREYEIARKALSAARAGQPPSVKCREAVSKAKKGVALSAEQRRKMSDALSVRHRVFILFGEEYFESPDFYRFCQEHRIGRSAVQKKLGTSPVAVITSGQHKGKCFSFEDVGREEMKKRRLTALTEAAAIRKSARLKQWESRTRTVEKTKIVIRLPSGEMRTFSSTCAVEQLGIPWATIQSCKNIPHTFKHGPAAGHTLLERTCL